MGLKINIRLIKVCNKHIADFLAYFPTFVGRVCNGNEIKITFSYYN